MNARLYDPLPGHFLSPDPYIQMPLIYGYCGLLHFVRNDVTDAGSCVT
jgi:hypothetical protein